MWVWDRLKGTAGATRAAVGMAVEQSVKFRKCEGSSICIPFL